MHMRSIRGLPAAPQRLIKTDDREQPRQLRLIEIGFVQGAQLRVIDGVPGASFAVWAPNAQRISVVGDFNNWDGHCHQMRPLGMSGVWEIFIPGVGEGAKYKFEVLNLHGNIILKTDPYGFCFEKAPNNASIVWNNHKFAWTDEMRAPPTP